MQSLKHTNKLQNLRLNTHIHLTTKRSAR